jgi:ribosomal protein S18 acetylase RimI-like enzyme
MDLGTASERVRLEDPSTISYFEKGIFRNALDIWSLRRGDQRYELYVCRVGAQVKAHLSIYRSPEANYVDLGGDSCVAETLLPRVPYKAVLVTTPRLRDSAMRRLKCDAAFSHDIMVVKRGEETLNDPKEAIRLSRKHDSEYSTFGTSFNIQNLPLEWVQERIDNDIIFGAFAEGKLVSAASLFAWLPQVSVIMSVETKPAFRRRGLGNTVLSAVVREGLKRSQSCALFVRTNNKEAIGLYSSLGFKKVGEEAWIDIGTGLVP